MALMRLLDTHNENIKKKTIKNQTEKFDIIFGDSYQTDRGKKKTKKIHIEMIISRI